MGALMALREELNGKLQVRGVKLSVNDLFLKALALAIADTPEANVQFADDALLQFERVDVSMAVSGAEWPCNASDTRRGQKAAVDDLRGGARADGQGRGGSAATGGLRGRRRLAFQFRDVWHRRNHPGINPPQSLVLGLGTVSDRVLPQQGELKTCPMLTATGSFDHRAIDGASAARLMAALRTLVEEPFALLVT